MGMLRMGTVALDGTKVHANASRHSALSYEHAGRVEAQLKAEVADLLAKAEAADRADLPDGLSIPDELARREERLKKLAEARAKLASADTAVNEKEMVMAERFADESRANAELASAKTSAAKAKAVNDEMKLSTGTLIEEMERSSGATP